MSIFSVRGFLISGCREWQKSLQGRKTENWVLTNTVEYNINSLISQKQTILSQNKFVETIKNIQE